LQIRAAPGDEKTSSTLRFIMSDKAVAETNVPSTNIDSTLQELRSFEPPSEFIRHAHIKSRAEYG
jgi:hypothetical protein